jgi:hypothetical protein
MKRTMILVTIAGLLCAGAVMAAGGYISPETLALAPAIGALGMLNVNQKGSDVVALCAAINPVSQGAGAVSSGWVAAKDFHRFLAVITAGVLGAAATLDFKIQQASDAGGTGVKDLAPAKAIAQMVKATDDNKVAEINFSAADLDLDGSFTHVRMTATVGVAASLISAHLLGIGPRFAPASDTDAAAVKEIV